MFEKLKLEVEEDVKQRNDLRQDKAHYGFNFVPHGAAFSVVREGNQIGKSITFNCGSESVIVRNADNGVILTASITLNDEGVCKFQVDGQDRESWQIRKAALEDILFGKF
jgi:hypothetical protein